MKKRTIKIFCFGMLGCIVALSALVTLTWNHWWWRNSEASVAVKGLQRPDCMVFQKGNLVMVAILTKPPEVPFKAFECIVVDPVNKSSFTANGSLGLSTQGPDYYVFRAFSLAINPLPNPEELPDATGVPPEATNYKPKLVIEKRDFQYTDIYAGIQVQVKHFR